ncbi:class A beta-lactamase-related serine hydrolase [Fulvivirga sp. RKSG066]|uniref:serine hydrolase domain-containing protein n=1 Tax=Fulvivirga aurantia TaxID=2529383 RepID=UPI0012BC6C21|nr:serine hydrolase domain-containing protein [Fulvivirga aurantia]MTI19749.1 class A beta-lactamase-related serine hydrolase [Fulvivirga aurantia]
MKQISLLAALLCLLLLTHCNTDNQEPSNHTLDKENNGTFDKDKLDKLLDLLNQNDKFMGTVALSHEGQVIYSKAIGYEDIENQTSSTNETKYRIGSTSKMFTATLVFKAIDDKKLNIDQTIDHYFPTIENAEKITVGNLLNHRSGIHSFTKDEAFWSYRTTYKSPQELLQIISSYESDFEPDSQREYSNSNYLLLSLMLEKLYDKSFSELLADQITTPLGLENTYYADGVNQLGNESNSYHYTSQWVKEEATNLSIPMGAGSMVSTPIDLNKFTEALFNEKIISKESLDLMTSTQDNLGMGIMPFPHKNKMGYGHGGHIDGFHTISIYYPEEKLAIALASNAIDYNLDFLTRDVLRCYFNEPFELPNFEFPEITASELEKYVGV